MYTNTGYDLDSEKIDEEIIQMDMDRDHMMELKPLTVYDIDSNSTCKIQKNQTPATSPIFSCLEKCKDAPLPENIFDANVTEEVYSLFEKDINEGGLNAILWRDIEEALENDEKVFNIRNALINEDIKTINEELKESKYQIIGPTKQQHIKSHPVSSQRIFLYTKIKWALEELTQNFYYNLHLGHRGVYIMLRLALGSVFWPAMKDALTGFYNKCVGCNQHMEKNKTK